MSTTITNALPDIPRLYTGICEWLACVVYLLVIYRRVPLRRTIAVGLIGLPAMIAIQYFDGVMPIWFWVIGMLLAFAGMWAMACILRRARSCWPNWSPRCTGSW